MYGYGNAFRSNFNLLTKCAGWAEVSQDLLLGDLGGVLTFQDVWGYSVNGTSLQLLFTLWAKQILGTQLYFLLVKDLFLQIEFKMHWSISSETRQVFW